LALVFAVALAQVTQMLKGDGHKLCQWPEAVLHHGHQQQLQSPNMRRSGFSVRDLGCGKMATTPT
jgi:hypothetical protein